MGDVLPENAPAKPVHRKDKYDKLYEKLCQTIGGLGLTMTGIPPVRGDGLVIVVRTQPFCKAWVDVAREHAWLYDLLVTISTGSVYLTLLSECAILTAFLLEVHGVHILPKELAPQLGGVGGVGEANGNLDLSAISELHAGPLA